MMSQVLNVVMALDAPDWLDLVIVPLVVIMNAVAFLLMRKDKSLARQQRWRVPESRLLGACAMFGAFGGLAGMYTYRHKTRKAKFVLLVPFLLILQLAALGLYFLCVR